MRLTLDRRQRLTEAVETALKIGSGTVAIESLEAPENADELSEERAMTIEQGTITTWSEDFACPDHGAFMPELSREYFPLTHHLELVLPAKA